MNHLPLRWVSNYSTATAHPSLHLPTVLAFNSENSWSQMSEHLRKSKKAFLRTEKEKA